MKAATMTPREATQDRDAIGDMHRPLRTMADVLLRMHARAAARGAALAPRPPVARTYAVQRGGPKTVLELLLDE